MRKAGDSRTNVSGIVTDRKKGRPSRWDGSSDHSETGASPIDVGPEAKQQRMSPQGIAAELAWGVVMSPLVRGARGGVAEQDIED